MRNRWRYLLLGIAVLLVAGFAVLSYHIQILGPRLKQRVITALEDRFDADVELKDLQFSFLPAARVEGKGLMIKHKGWGNDQHPLIRIRQFAAQTDYVTLLDWGNRVDKVVLQGLEIYIPPRGRATDKASVEANQPVSSSEPGHDRTRFRFLITTIIADGSLVEIEPKNPGKDPLRFPIEKLTMHSVGPGEAMEFTARLTNAKPPGGIDTTGHFGPWQRDDPRATALSGNYTFQNADLSVFKGISGTLASTGKYDGILQHIAVDGVTDTPKFNLTEGGIPVHLRTRFHAVVDGTNGDTILDPVDATFGHSEFICSGGVVQKGGIKGKTVDLDAHTKQGRIEDILALVMNGKPIMDGPVEFQSSIVIPPGKEKVMAKLGLSGQFHLDSARFTSEKAAERLRTLSDRALGISKSEEEKGEGEQGNIASNMFARFALHHGVISFSPIRFQVPGAQIQLAGQYNLNNSNVDMKGTFAMRATLSQTQSGWKAVLLKPFDPMFKKKGEGFEVPLSVAGDRNHPIIGVSLFHRTFTIH